MIDSNIILLYLMDKIQLGVSQVIMEFIILW